MEGRRLKTAQKGSTLLSFVYNDEGLRTEKTVGSGESAVVHHYYYDGSLLLAEEWSGNVIFFLYDENGAPVGMRYHAAADNEDVWSVYWYETNLQGDVVAIYSSTGTKLATYTYDAWGKTSVSYVNSGASTGAYYNPLRYRGYYYDTETNLYYLQSRYYDPAICRFLNADGVLQFGLLSYNLFVYCRNNPVVRYDPTGWADYCCLSNDDISALFGPAMKGGGGGGGGYYSGYGGYDYTRYSDYGAYGGYGTVAIGLAIAALTIVAFNRTTTTSKVEDKPISIADTIASQPVYNYWEAFLVDKQIVVGRGLTYSEARERVAAQQDLLCRNQDAALAIVGFYPSMLYEPAHNNGKCGYLPHYHLNGAHTNHIWFLG